MKSENNIAFKEWASIVNALAGGEQILVLRKGGIREESGEFQVEHNEFFLFPTYEHQNREELKPGAFPYLDRALKQKPNTAELSIQYYSETKNISHISDEAQLKSISPFHVWSDGAIAQRFHYGKTKGLYLLAVRIFKLPNPYTVTLKPEYAGCKSWVELDHPLSTAGAKTVLPNRDFETKLSQISNLFSPTKLS